MPSKPEKLPSPSPNVRVGIDMGKYLRTATYDQALKIYAEIPKIPTLDTWLLGHIAKNDRFFLLTTILRRPDALHPWLFERCRDVEREPYDHLDLWARTHYKSTIITFAGSIQEIIQDPEVTIGIFSCTRPIAKAFLDQIKSECETNPALYNIWPDIFWGPKEKPSTWGLDSGLVFKRKSNPKERTIEAWGVVDGQPTSKHFKILLYDDVVVPESVGTPEMIQKTTDRLELSFNLGTPHTKGGREIFVGTRYAFGDTYQTLKDRGVVTLREHPATDDGTFDGKPVFLSPEEWVKLKQSTSKFTVACQQLLNPIAGSEQTFDPNHLRLFEVRPLTLNVYILCDPANSRNKYTNRTSMAVIGVDKHFNKYLLDGYCHRMKLSERWEKLRDLRAKWLRAPGIQLVKVGYEKYGMQSDVDHFEEMMKLENRYFEVNEVSWTKDGQQSKNDRVQRLQPDFENWRFFLPYSYEMTRLVADLTQAELPDAKAANNMTKAQQSITARGEGFRVARPIRQINEEGLPYDVTQWFVKNEYVLFPSIHPDFMDAMSRVYDIDIAAPQLYDEEALEPVATADY